MTTTTEQTTFRHGRTGYDKHGCRCPICRAANTLHCAKVRARRLARMQADPEDRAHGTINGYNARCRCEACGMARHVRYAREVGHRRHTWRETVTATYRAARQAWEERRESQTYGYLQHRSAASRDRATWGHRTYTDEHAEFLASNPAPTLRRVLEAMAGQAPDGFATAGA